MKDGTKPAPQLAPKANSTIQNAKVPKNLADALRDLASRTSLLKTLTDNATVGLFMMDEKQHCTFMNPAAEQITGYTLKEVQGQPLHNFVHHTHPDGTPYPLEECPIDRALPQKNQEQGEETFVHKNGRLYPVGFTASPIVVDGKPTGTIIEARDLTEEKQAEQSLRDSEERFRTLIEQSADAIQLVTPEGKVLFSSDSVKHVLGYAPKEIQDVVIAPFIHPDDWDAFAKQWAHLLKKPKRQKTLQYRVKHKNGSWVWVETTVTNHVNTPNIKAIVGNFRNISDRKEFERKIVESEIRFRELADSLPLILWTTEPDGTVSYFNKQWYRFTGISEGTTKHDLAAIVHPDDYEALKDTWRHSVEYKTTFQLEYRLKRSGGDNVYRWFLGRIVPILDEVGDITKWYGTATDIEDTRRTIRRKQQLEAKAANLAEQRAQLITINNAKDEFISLASHQLRTPATGVKQYLGMLREGYAGILSDKQIALLERAYESNERQITIVNDLLRVAQIDAGKVILSRDKTDLKLLIKDILNEQAAKFKSRHQHVFIKAGNDDYTAEIDPDRIRMVIENIIDNASKYTDERKSIIVSMEKNKQSILIHVKDQGVGIPEDQIESIFKKFNRLDNKLSVSAGGNGLGLYWADKIVALHGGEISVSSAVNEGSVFTINLPLTTA